MGKMFPTVLGPLRFEDFSIDLQTNVAERGDVAIRFSPMQAEIIYILVSRAPDAVTHIEFDFGLYGNLDSPDNFIQVLATQIYRMRKRLAELGVFIEATDDFGYRLELQPMYAEAAA